MTRSAAVWQKQRWYSKITGRTAMNSVFNKIGNFLREHGRKLVLSVVLLVQTVFAVAVYYFVIHVKEIKVRVPHDTHWWVPWIPAVAAVIAAAAALITLYTNRRTTERNFDRQASESLFADILNRFASRNPIIRANAAIRLGDVVEKNWPGRPKKKTKENYPFFPDASSQLAAALHIENNKAVRGEILKALARITNFAKSDDGQDDQSLLHLLIRELADANLSAKAAFVEALARGCSRIEEVTADALWPLVPFAPFCKVRQHSWACLFSLATSEECHAAKITKTIRRKAQTEEGQREGDLRFLPDIEACVDRLVATRDALATALCALATPVDLPSDATQLMKWKRAVPLVLNGCFLAGANLPNARLEGAEFQEALLQGADLTKAQLQRAGLAQATCQAARLTNAQAQGADSRWIKLQAHSLAEHRCRGRIFLMPCH
jgi:hypothetical protein